VALLIGNAHYANPALTLRNPANDALGFAEVLDDLGFETQTVIDGGRDALLAELDLFAERAAGASMAVVFYAGHGVQVEGTNHLLAAGFNDLTPVELESEAITLDEILTRLDRADPEVAYVILDACRNNPFSVDGRAALGLARSQGRTGTLIAYATDPGNVASDGTGSNGAFTQALIENLATPGVEARLMFGRVRQQVVLSTWGDQVPYVEEAVLGEHYFKPAPAAVAAGHGFERDVQLWRETTADGSPEAFRRYLAAMPDGLFMPFARERLEQPVAGAGLAANATDAFAGADADDLVAALSALGYLAPSRGMLPDQPEIEAALKSYLRQMTDAGQATPDRLYSDAAMVTVVLGSTTAQRIRTDMAALAAISTVLGTADRARTELVSLAATEPDAVTAALDAAKADLAAIETARQTVLARLDESRSYYAELVGRGQSELAGYLPRALAGLVAKARTVPSVEGRLLGNAELFIQHASAAGSRDSEGSYSWLVDFLP
jgi:hypothetical protein